MKQCFALTSEQIALLGLDADETWFGFLAIDEEHGDRRTYVTTDSTAFESMSAAIESEVLPPPEFGEWMASAFRPVAGWPDTWSE